jgi:hypothetical protein
MPKLFSIVLPLIFNITQSTSVQINENFAADIDQLFNLQNNFNPQDHLDFGLEDGNFDWFDFLEDIIESNDGIGSKEELLANLKLKKQQNLQKGKGSAHPIRKRIFQNVPQLDLDSVGPSSGDIPFEEDIDVDVKKSES